MTRCYNRGMSRTKVKGPDGHPYRISEIISRSGFSRQAIHFYLKEGLLPPPVKTSKNLGWYSEQHLETLALIKKLQHERFLPLKAIKSLLQGSGDFDFSEPQLEILSGIRARLGQDHDDLSVGASPGDLAEEMGLSSREQKELRDHLFLAKSGVATVSDVEITRLWIKMRDAGISEERGFSPKDLLFIYELADRCVEKEIKILRKRIHDLPPAETTALVDVVVPAINTIFCIVHQRKLKAYIESFLERSQSNPG